jgi:hypothetical protein
VSEPKGRLAAPGDHQVYVRSVPSRETPSQEGTERRAPSLAGRGPHHRAAHQFKNARIVVLPRTGRVAHMEHPGVVAAEIGILLAAAGQGADDPANDRADDGRAREFPLASAG